MKTINAAITPMQEVRLFGEPALFTPERVSRDTVHLGLFPYELETEPPLRSGTPPGPGGTYENPCRPDGDLGADRGGEHPVFSVGL